MVLEFFIFFVIYSQMLVVGTTTRLIFHQIYVREFLYFVSIADKSVV